MAQAARDLGIHQTLLTRWKRDLSRDEAHAFLGKGRLKPLEEEVRRLRRENVVLKQEREMLKKAAAFFATRERARAEVFDYIEVFYNRQRRHSSLGYLSQAAFESSVA